MRDWTAMRILTASNLHRSVGRRAAIAALEQRVRALGELLHVPTLELVAARRIGADRRRIEVLRRQLA
jgi:hypothetical protein